MANVASVIQLRGSSATRAVYLPPTRYDKLIYDGEWKEEAMGWWKLSDLHLSDAFKDKGYHCFH